MTDLNEILGIPHRRGCPVPAYVDALPFATMTGRNPYIQKVGDGHGGTLDRCVICGRFEGEDLSDDDPIEAVKNLTPEQPSEVDDDEFIAAVRADLEAHRLVERQRWLNLRDIDRRRGGTGSKASVGRADRLQRGDSRSPLEGRPQR